VSEAARKLWSEGGFIYILVKRTRGGGSGEQGRKIKKQLVLYPYKKIPPAACPLPPRFFCPPLQKFISVHIWINKILLVR
jgi:hypothetical protein